MMQYLNTMDGLVNIEPAPFVTLSAHLSGGATLSVSRKVIQNTMDGVVSIESSGIVPVVFSAHLSGGATLGTCSMICSMALFAPLSAGADLTTCPVRTRGFAADLHGSAAMSTRVNLIAAVKASLEGAGSLKVGVLRLIIPTGVYNITADHYYRKSQPAKSDELANYIKVYTSPLRPSDTVEEVYRTSDDSSIVVPAGKTVTATARYNKPPVIDAVASLVNPPLGVSIIEVAYYAWGAEATIANDGTAEAQVSLVITGRRLEVQGQQLVVAQDGQSITENGRIEYEFPSNPLVQNPAMAERIASQLLAFAIPRRDVQLEWKGNPALVLADIIQVPEFQRGLIDKRGLFYITRQHFQFSGALRTITDGRKIK